MIVKTLEKELNLKDWQVKKVIKLIDDGNTIPFIARYRKDVTGSLNDETLRKFDERLKYLRNLEENTGIDRVDQTSGSIPVHLAHIGNSLVVPSANIDVRGKFAKVEEAADILAHTAVQTLDGRIVVRSFVTRSGVTGIDAREESLIISLAGQGHLSSMHTKNNKTVCSKVG